MQGLSQAEEAALLQRRPSRKKLDRSPNTRRLHKVRRTSSWFHSIPLPLRVHQILRTNEARVCACLMQLVHSIWDLFGALEGQELASHDTKSIMLVLGQSVARPREVYHLTGVPSSAHDARSVPLSPCHPSIGSSTRDKAGLASAEALKASSSRLRIAECLIARRDCWSLQA